MLKDQPMEGLIEVRPSMRKFVGNEYELGIIRCATFSVAYLNRQIIMLLSNLGVHDSVFKIKLEDAKKMLDKNVTQRNLLRQVKA